jgi:ribose-phosphate pyrophosphokinase
MGEWLVFWLPSQRRLGREFRGRPDVTFGRFSMERFANGERHIHLNAPVAGKRCVVLGTVSPPAENLLSYLLLCHTLRSQGAGSVTALLPYLAYSRHDRKEPLESHGAAWMGSLLGAAGVTSVITVDVHSPRLKRLFPIPLHSVSPAAIFADEIRRRSLQDATMVAPDKGAIARCQAVARAAGMERPVATMTKRRTRDGVVHGRLQGKVGPRAVVVDDMLDTGGTLISCCEELRRSGARALYVFVTHGLFTGDAWRRLRGLGVRLIACTDTVPVRPAVAKNVTICSASALVVRGALER